MNCNCWCTIVTIRVVGGEAAAASTLAPKIGPLGLSPKKVGDDIAKATKEWKGIRVSVKLIVQNRQAAVELVPTATSLVIKALNEPYRDRKKEKNVKHHGNLSLNDVIGVAKIMRPRSLAKTFSGTVLEILGTCAGVGCTIDNKSAADMIAAVKDGSVTVKEPSK